MPGPLAVPIVAGVVGAGAAGAIAGAARGAASIGSRILAYGRSAIRGMTTGGAGATAGALAGAATAGSRPQPTTVDPVIAESENDRVSRLVGTSEQPAAASVAQQDSPSYGSAAMIAILRSIDSNIKNLNDNIRNMAPTPSRMATYSAQSARNRGDMAGFGIGLAGLALANIPTAENNTPEENRENRQRQVEQLGSAAQERTARREQIQQEIQRETPNITAEQLETQTTQRAISEFQTNLNVPAGPSAEVLQSTDNEARMSAINADEERLRTLMTETNNRVRELIRTSRTPASNSLTRKMQAANNAFNALSVQYRERQSPDVIALAREDLLGMVNDIKRMLDQPVPASAERRREVPGANPGNQETTPNIEPQTPAIEPPVPTPISQTTPNQIMSAVPASSNINASIEGSNRQQQYPSLRTNDYVRQNPEALRIASADAARINEESSLRRVETVASTSSNTNRPVIIAPQISAGNQAPPPAPMPMQQQNGAPSPGTGAPIQLSYRSHPMMVHESRSPAYG